MKPALLLVLSLLLAGCPGPSDPPAPRADDAANVIGAPLEQSLDKARSVEELNGQRQGGLDEAIDAAN